MLKFAGKLVGAVITTATGQGAVLYLHRVGWDLPEMAATMTDDLISSGAIWWFMSAAFMAVGWYAVALYQQRTAVRVAPAILADMRALDYPKIKTLLDDDSERRKLVELMRNGTLTTWAYQKGARDHEKLTPGHWKNASLAYDVVDGQPVTNVVPNSVKRIRPWTKEPVPAKLEHWHDVYFNKDQMQKHWPGKF